MGGKLEEINKEQITPSGRYVMFWGENIDV